MAAYLEEVRKLEKCFLGLELHDITRDINKEANDIVKQASHHEAQSPGVFEERLFKPSATHPRHWHGAAPRGASTRIAHGRAGLWPDLGSLFFAGAGAPGGSYAMEFKAFLFHATLTEEESKVERDAR